MRSFTRSEVHDLVKSWLLVSLAFGIFLAHDALWPFRASTVATNLLIALVTVGIGIVLHELAHKVVARRLGYAASYRADDTLLVLGLIASVAGFFFAAPGFVQYKGPSSPRNNGIIAAAGPLANIGLAALFLILALLLPAPWNGVALFGAVINSWVAVFNLLPFGLFDGAKVLAWSKAAYFSIVAVSVIFAIATQVPSLLA